MNRGQLTTQKDGKSLDYPMGGRGEKLKRLAVEMWVLLPLLSPVGSWSLGGA